MKKRIGLLIFYMITVTACSSLKAGPASGSIPSSSMTAPESAIQTEAQHPTIEIPETDANCGPLCKDGDVESNINSGDLSEDSQEPDLNGGNEIPGDEGPSGLVGNDGQEESGPLTVSIIQSYNTQLPANLPLSLKYDRYKVDTDYLVVLNEGVNIREQPDTGSKLLRTAQYLERFKLEAAVKGQVPENHKSDMWYEISWTSGSVSNTGYIYSELSTPRSFQFEKMLDAVNKLQERTIAHISGYIANYKNRNGQAPAYKDKTEDLYGVDRYQSAPAYLEASTSSDFRYITDGTHVSILGETDSFYKISTLNFEGEYFVPKKYVAFGEAVKELKKAIVVDRENQNEGIFELIDNKWHLVSYIYATTGETAKYKQATDLGYYTAIQKVESFRYLDDITKEIAGYAPYAIRFNGGAYVHGVPIDYKKVDGALVDPGMQEFLYTIGTIPRSHKCVRNYTSHALFLYNWVEIGSSAVIVIE